MIIIQVIWCKIISFDQISLIECNSIEDHFIWLKLISFDKIRLIEVHLICLIWFKCLTMKSNLKTGVNGNCLSFPVMCNLKFWLYMRRDFRRCGTEMSCNINYSLVITAQVETVGNDLISVCAEEHAKDKCHNVDDRLIWNVNLILITILITILIDN